jgi:hypothetical protein
MKVSLARMEHRGIPGNVRHDNRVNASVVVKLFPDCGLQPSPEGDFLRGAPKGTSFGAPPKVTSFGASPKGTSFGAHPDYWLD